MGAQLHAVRGQLGLEHGGHHVHHHIRLADQGVAGGQVAHIQGQGAAVGVPGHPAGGRALVQVGHGHGPAVFRAFDQQVVDQAGSTHPRP
jgi:hypothetical protein